MALKTPKNLLLPKADNIRDPETKKIIQQMLKIIERMNQVTFGDLSGHEERITDLE